MNMKVEVNTARPASYFVGVAIVVALVAIFMLPQENLAQSKKVSGDLLFVSQDKQSVEKAIAAYIERESGIKADISVVRTDTDDVSIRYTIEPEEAPKITLSIDTQPTNYNADKTRVTEQAISFMAFYVLPEEAKTPEMRHKILELNNSRKRQYWFPGRTYLDKDGDIVIESYLNIPGPNIPVHAEMCKDIVFRTVVAWREYYRELAKLVPVKPQD